MEPSPRPSVFIIAEAGVNHNGKEDLAMRLVDAACDAGADAVKFQLFDPDELAGAAPLASYQEGKDAWRDQKEMLASLMLPKDAYRRLADHAKERQIELIVTPFDIASAKFLLSLKLKTLKIPSGEVTNLPFLKNVAALGADVILSTGMCSLEEVKEAVEIFRANKVPLTLLHCVSAYPAPADQINLRTMETLRQEFHVPVGYSDHTEGVAVALTAAALGAQVLEKHFTLDRTMSGPDHAASLEPEELTQMIRIIKDAEALKNVSVLQEALGTGEKKCQPCEENVRSVARRSVVAGCDLQKGGTLTAEMIAIRRPGTGIAPKFVRDVIGKKAKKDILSGTPLIWDILE
ncbi:MAG: N-acetylneuraminate synthase family protein [Candidatus Peribacteraceae bacterium]|nr:N-acetylneuraminate synthase family protein [Candidatus Peribacteraceae bacterium]MDD5740088.1 N-acetylneuraminate synthase family protein [Candidatus Peribacteraceae bacterium]